MARVTVEDCVEKVPNRFELVALAAQRARHISAGAPPTLERDNDKNPVVALREIAEETVDQGELGEALVKSLQKHVETDYAEEDIDLLIAAEGMSADAAAEVGEKGAVPGAGAVDDMAPGASMGGAVFEDAVPDDD